MIVRRALLSPLIVFFAVVGQLAVVNRLPLPGHGLPDLVLLAVAALGVAARPATGLLAGFAGGLALDVAPPGGHLAGEYALIFCLVGYACGRIRDLLQGSDAERSATTSLLVTMAGVAAGEAAKAGLGLMLSDPDMTGPAIRHVLPAAVLYDLLGCPFVLWLVSVIVGTPATESAPRPQFPPSLRLVPAFRQASAGAVPRLRLAGSTPPPVPPPVRAEPKLRLAAGRSSLSSRTNGAFSPARGSALSGRKTPRLNLASGGRGNQLGGASALRAPQGAGLSGKSPAKGWLRPPRARGARGARGGAGPAVRRRKSPGRGWIVAGSQRRPAWPANWQAKTPGKGWIRSPKPQGMTTWRRRSPGRGWIVAGSQRRPASPANWQAKTPGKGWARSPKPPPAPKRKSPGKGWLRPARPPAAPKRKSPGKGWLRPARPPRQNWYTKGPSTRWLRRGRRRRLLLGGRR